jgi:hypothetical protein
MAATDSFESFNASLSPHDRERLKDFIADQTVEQLAARSEDARARIVYDYIQQAKEHLSAQTKTSHR